MLRGVAREQGRYFEKSCTANSTLRRILRSSLPPAAGVTPFALPRGRLPLNLKKLQNGN
jgi:hypothetical protein